MLIKGSAISSSDRNGDFVKDLSQSANLCFLLGDIVIRIINLTEGGNNQDEQKRGEEELNFYHESVNTPIWPFFAYLTSKVSKNFLKIMVFDNSSFSPISFTFSNSTLDILRLSERSSWVSSQKNEWRNLMNI